MADAVEFTVEVKGTDEAVSDLNRVTAAERQAVAQTASATPIAAQAAAAQRQMSQAMSATAASAQQLGQRAGQVGSALGQVGTVIGRLSPELGSIGQVIGQVGGATTALSGAMGPLGLALAGVTTAVSLGSLAWEAYENHLAETERRQRALTEVFGTTELGLAQANLARAQMEADRLRTEGSAEEFSRAAESVRVFERNVARIRAQEDERFAAEARDRHRRELDERFQRENEAGNREYEAAVAEIDREERLRNEGRARQEAREREYRARLRAMDQADAEARRAAMSDVERAIREEMALEEQRVQIRNQIDEQLAANSRALRERDAEAARQAFELQKQQAQQRSEIMRGVYDAEAQGLQSLLSATDAANRSLISMHQRTLSSAEVWGSGMRAIGNDVANAVGTNLQSAFSASLGAWLDGSKSFGEAALDMVRGVTRALTQEGIVQAIVETARGLGALATTWGVPNPAATLHFASAGVWAAIAGGAGLIGAAAGAFGGGGRATSAGAGAGGQRAALPATGTSSGPTNITVNLMTPNAVLTEAERGQMIAASMREARRQFGASGVRT